MTARRVCLDALLQVEENEGYSNIVLDKALRAAALEPRDSALASTLFYGVLEKELTLDYVIAQFLKNPNQKLENGTAMLLRMAVYQILYLDRIPDSAAVNESVSLAKATGRGRYAGLINAVLRQFLRNRDALVWPDEKSDLYKAYSVRYAIPQPLIRLWDQAYGREHLLPMLEALSDRAALYVRVNSLKVTDEALCSRLEAEGCTVSACTFVEHALKIEKLPGRITDLPSFQEGLFHVQDTASQLLCALVEPKPNTVVADVCAAPGGKSFTMAEKMENTGHVFSFDLYKGRVGLIKDGAQRLGLTNLTASVRDASAAQDDFMADTVLCDVPCSGFGVIRRKPEIRRKKPSDAAGLPAIQSAILENAAAHVKPGGRLVYSTCTLNPAENTQVAERFLAGHPEFEPDPILRDHALDEPSYMLTMLPGVLDTDGFFVARFRRRLEDT